MMRRQLSPRTTARSRRPAVIGVQLVFLLPLMVLVIVAAVQFAVWSVARQTVGSAAIDGARVAATGGKMREIVPAVRKTLAAYDLAPTQDSLLILVERSGDQPRHYGNLGLRDRRSRRSLPHGEVRVTVFVRPGSHVPVWIGRSSKHAVLQSTCLMITH